VKLAEPQEIERLSAAAGDGYSRLLKNSCSGPKKSFSIPQVKISLNKIHNLKDVILTSGH
jgi:hypothetical protein